MALQCASVSLHFSGSVHSEHENESEMGPGRNRFWSVQRACRIIRWEHALAQCSESVGSYDSLEPHTAWQARRLIAPYAMSVADIG
eukprot:884894-Rhodomonas_salina.1